MIAALYLHPFLFCFYEGYQAMMGVWECQNLPGSVLYCTVIEPFPMKPLNCVLAVEGVPLYWQCFPTLCEGLVFVRGYSRLVGEGYFVFGGLLILFLCNSLQRLATEWANIISSTVGSDLFLGSIVLAIHFFVVFFIHFVLTGFFQCPFSINSFLLPFSSSVFIKSVFGVTGRDIALWFQ